MKIVFLITCILAITLGLSAQSSIEPERKQLNDSCDKFMKLFQSGKQTDAIRMLKTISLMEETAIDKLAEQVEGQLETIEANYGKAMSYEFIKEKEVNGIIIKRFYLLKLEKFYLKFTFTLYKSKTGWKATHFIYDEDIDALFN